jgi:hypothetical protein
MESNQEYKVALKKATCLAATVNTAPDALEILHHGMKWIGNVEKS